MAALTVLVEIAKDKTASPNARVSAANAIQDRGYGRPVPMTVEPPRDRLAEAVREINMRVSAAPIRTRES